MSIDIIHILLEGCLSTNQNTRFCRDMLQEGKSAQLQEKWIVMVELGVEHIKLGVKLQQQTKEWKRENKLQRKRKEYSQNFMHQTKGIFRRGNRRIKGHVSGTESVCFLIHL